MSAPRLNLRITTRAAQDVRNIQRYTLETWGAIQASSYETAIDLALEAIRTQPRLGRARDELRAGLRSFPIQSHTIYYRVIGNTLIVSRILHQRIDATRERLA